MQAAYGIAKRGMGVVSMEVMQLELVIKSIMPVVMARVEVMWLELVMKSTMLVVMARVLGTSTLSR